MMAGERIKIKLDHSQQTSSAGMGHTDDQGEPRTRSFILDEQSSGVKKWNPVSVSPPSHARNHGRNKSAQFVPR